MFKLYIPIQSSGNENGYVHNSHCTTVKIETVPLNLKQTKKKKNTLDFKLVNL